MPPARRLGLGFGYRLAGIVRAFVCEKSQNYFLQGNALGSHIFRFPGRLAVSKEGPVISTHLDCPAFIKPRQHVHDGDASLPQVGRPLAVKVQYQDADWVAASSRATYFSAITAHYTPPPQRFGKQAAAYLDAAARVTSQAAKRRRLLSVAIIERCRIHWENTFHFCARGGVVAAPAAATTKGTRARTYLKRKGFQHIASYVCVCGDCI
jgi:hypothetical protein